MTSHDPARVLREYVIEPLRREICPEWLRTLVIRDGGPVEAAPASCDGAWIELAGWDGVEPSETASGVVRALRSGGRLGCVVPGAWPLGELLSAGLRGRGSSPGALRARLGGGRPRVTFSAWRRAFEPEIVWRRSLAFGVLVPEAAAWPRRQPLALGLVAMAEDVVRQWPLLRTLGEWVVHEGVHR